MTLAIATFALLALSLVDSILWAMAIHRARKQREAWPLRPTGIVVDRIEDTF